MIKDIRGLCLVVFFFLLSFLAFTNFATEVSATGFIEDWYCAHDQDVSWCEYGGSYYCEYDVVPAGGDVVCGGVVCGESNECLVPSYPYEYQYQYEYPTPACVPHACDAPMPSCASGPRTTYGSDGCGNGCSLSISCEAICGNGSVESGEQCDSGVNNGSCPRDCSNSCTVNSCSYEYQYQYPYPTPAPYEYQYPYPTPYVYEYQYQYQYEYPTPAAPFNYSLSNSGTSSVAKSSENVFTQNTITKTLLAGTSEAVALSVSGVPSGVSYSISSSSCSPTCVSVITFTVSSTALIGSHTITVTGSPLGKTTAFTLSITANSFPVSCSVSDSTVYIGQTVTYSATVSGGVPPLTYSWSGTNMPTPAPSTNPYSRSYSTTGQKSAELTVTDDEGSQSTCAAVTVVVIFDPDFMEF